MKTAPPMKRSMPYSSPIRASKIRQDTRKRPNGPSGTAGRGASQGRAAQIRRAACSIVSCQAIAMALSWA